MDVLYRLQDATRVNILTILFTSEERGIIQGLCVDNGGVYSPDFSKKCTHLIASQAGGLKYQFASRWNIPIVTKKWLQDSIARKGLLNPMNYLFKSENRGIIRISS
jgi:NAD-dependent DNA ligase